MKKLVKHIEFLLYFNECVIIPGFGGFLTNQEKAAYKSFQHTFTPSSKRVAFNESLNRNDGLLASHLCKYIGFSYEEAMCFISQEVSDFKLALSSHNKMELKGLGFFSYNFENRLQFEPDSTRNFDLKSYGLSVVVSPAIERLISTKREKLFVDRKPKIISSSDVEKLPLKLKWVTAIAAPIILFVVVGAFNNRILQGVYSTYESSIDTYLAYSYNTVKKIADFKINIHTTNESADKLDSRKIQVIPEMKNEEKELIVIEDVNKQKHHDSLSKVKTAPNQSDNEQTKNTAKPEKNIPAYYLIGGCFGVESNAKMMVEALKQEGYEALLAGRSKDGLYRVAFAKFSSEKEAAILHGKVIASGRSAWILSQ